MSQYQRRLEDCNYVFPKCMCARFVRLRQESMGTGELVVARKPREGNICILHSVL